MVLRAGTRVRRLGASRLVSIGLSIGAAACASPEDVGDDGVSAGGAGGTGAGGSGASAGTGTGGAAAGSGTGAGAGSSGSAASAGTGGALDAGLEAPLDGADNPDAADAPPADVGADTASDALLDAPGDAASDATLDAPLDAPDDAPGDAGTDAGQTLADTCPGETLVFTGSPPFASAQGDLGSLQADYTGSCGGGAGADAVYRMVAPQQGVFTASVVPAGFDAVLYLRYQTCTASDVICRDQAGPGGTESLQMNGPAGMTVYLVVDSATGSAGPFTLSVSY